MGLTEAQSEVRGLVRSRTAFATIEDRIEAISDLDDNERAALWLYAWSCQPGSWQRRTSMQHLQWIAKRSLEVTPANPLNMPGWPPTPNNFPRDSEYL